MIMAASPVRMASINCSTRCRATVNRVALPAAFTMSSAFMLAELSITKINRLPPSRVARQLGFNKAIAISSSSSNCSHNNKLRRNRCQRLLTCRSSIDLRHK